MLARALAATTFLHAASCGGDAPPDPVTPDAADPDGADPSDDPLDGVGEVTLVSDGFMFTEGPQWIADDGVLLFTDIDGNTIHRLTPPATIDVFRAPSDNANGLALLPDGRLITAEHETRRVTVTETDGAVTTLVDDLGGLRLNSPNDLVARDDGTIYFTDPPYGISAGERELGFMGVFRIAPGADQPVAEWEGPLSARPNGVALSPDQSILYVADTTGTLRAWDVAGDGSLDNERTLSTEVPGADGLAVDAAGNLFVTTSAGVRVLAADGTVWGTIDVPRTPANCAFGGDDLRTLYITARTSLYRVALANPGLATR